MRGEKTIKFDFDFSFPTGDGEFGYANAIDIRAPGLGKHDVYFTVKSYVSKALTGFAKLRGDIEKPKADKDIDLDDEPVEESNDEDSDEIDTMAIMAAGLDVKAFQELALYLRRALTASPKLATVSGTKTAVTDEVWHTIDEKGGMDAINKVLCAYIDFFLESQTSRSRNGKKKSTGSDLPAKDTSRTATAKNSHSKK